MMQVAAYLRPSTLIWYLFMILARLREDILAFVKIFILRLPLSFFWSKTNDLVLYFHNATRDLTKLPKHISFIVMEDEVDIASVSEAVVWCIVLGMSCISIADKHGLLTRHKNKLDQLVSSRLAQLNVPVKAAFYQPPSNFLELQQAAASVSGVHAVSVAILSPVAGRQLLASAAVALASTPAEQLGEDMTASGSGASGISVSRLEKAMYDLSGLIDADLAFRIGHTDSLFLPSPWHFRLAEFYRVDSQRALTPEVFMDGLRFYSRVDQRFGK